MAPSHISWIHPSATPATEEMIQHVERALGVRYPADFRTMAPAIHGASPEPEEFFLMYPKLQRRTGSSLGVVLSFDSSAGYDYVLSLFEAHRGEGILPAGVVPFGKDGGGDLMAFDFRKDPIAPPVVYVAISCATDDEGDERHIVPLADSFTEFLGMLQDPDAASPPSEAV